MEQLMFRRKGSFSIGSVSIEVSYEYQRHLRCFVPLYHSMGKWH